MVGTVDIAVMGRLPDPAYIGAVTLGATLFSSVYWLFGFLRMGTTGLVAQDYGASNNPASAIPIFLRGLVIAAVLSLLLLIFQTPLQTLLFTLFSPQGQVAELTAIYFSIRIWGAPGLLLYLVALGVLFGLQRMRDTLWLSIGFNLTNLILDLVLVLGFEMGVAGVATGTVISEWGAAVLGCALVIRACGERPRYDASMLEASAMRQLFSVSSNLLLRTFFVQLPFLVGTALATQTGELVLAAHGILMQLFFIMTYALDGFAHTAETLAGYCYGARQRAALRAASIYSSLWALAFGVTAGVIFLLFGEVLIDGFTVSDAVRETAYDYLLWLALVPLFCTGAFLLDGIFIGTTFINEMRNAMMASALLWAGLLWLTWPVFGYHAVWLSMNVFMLLRTGLLLAYYPRIERGADL